MSTLNSSLNVTSCGASEALGTGLKGCKKFFKKAVKAWLVPQGYTFDGAQDFTDDYVNTLIADGKISVLSNIASIDDESKQNTYEDIGDGIDVLDVDGLYGFKLKFIQGLYNQEVLQSLSGNARYDILFVDATGKLLGTLASDGTSLKGFTLGVHQVEIMEGFLSKNTAREAFKIQMTNIYEMSSTAIKEKDTDFNGLNAVGVNEVVLTYVNTPADTDTTITVKAVRKNDGAAFTGAVFGQFNVKINGATANPTGGDDSATTGTFVLTGITAISTNDVVAISLYDNTNNRAGILVGSDYYKSNTATKTAV